MKTENRERWKDLGDDSLILGEVVSVGDKDHGPAGPVRGLLEEPVAQPEDVLCLGFHGFLPHFRQNLKIYPINISNRHLISMQTISKALMF